MALGDIPWPDALYLDASGHVRVAGIPGPLGDAMAEGLGELDGFGTRPTVRFSFDGPLDATSLPATPEESLQDEASVFLVDADTGSPQAFRRVPVNVRYESESRRVLLSLAHGLALVPGRRYAAVVTDAVRGDDGRRVEPAARFEAIRDPERVLDDALERAARELYAPVLENLSREGTPRSDVVSLAVFRVQTVGAELEDARAMVLAAPPPAVRIDEVLTGGELDAVLGVPPQLGSVGLDAPGGVPHDQIGAMAHGSVSAPDLLIDGDEPHGHFERSSTGELVRKGDVRVYFTLWLPRSLEAGSVLPVVVVQHGLGGDRSDALPLANELAAGGYAVIAADAPFHGSAAGTGDARNRFTGAEGPDGFGDVAGDFSGREAGDGPLPALHPYYYRDAMRQGVTQLFALARALEVGDWSSLEAREPDLEEVGFDAARVGFVGVDVGAEMGVMLAAHEPAFRALVLAFADGLGPEGWLAAPRRQARATSLVQALGRDPAALDGVDVFPEQWPELDAWRTLAARGTGGAHVAALRRSTASVLLWLARGDEVVSNAATEAFAAGLGAVMLGGEPQRVPDLMSQGLRSGNTLAGNFTVEERPVTRAVYVFDPAAHDAAIKVSAERRFEHPLERPFVELDEPEPIENPLADILMQAAFFFQSWRSCSASDAACAASVIAP
ncbi:MAG: hypothetical protein PVI30_21790 [Myxococcales bacterium]